MPINTPNTREICVTGITFDISPVFRAKNRNNSKKPNKTPEIIIPILFN